MLWSLQYLLTITLIKHSKVMSNLGLFPQFLYALYKKSYILGLVTECLKYQLGGSRVRGRFNHHVIFKAILCFLSLPSSIRNPTLSPSQVSIMGVLVLVTLTETLNLFMYKIPLLPRYIPTFHLSFLNKMMIALLFQNALVTIIHITSP